MKIPPNKMALHPAPKQYTKIEKKKNTTKTHFKASFLEQRTTTYPNDDAEMRHIIFKQGISSYHSHEVRCRDQESL